MTYSSAGSCSNTGATFTITSATGTCTVRYDQAGNASFNPAPQVTESVTAVKINQTITFAALGNKTFGDADFNVSATASSGLAVSFAASGSCTVSGTTVHLTGAGSCTITASQAGNGNFNAAADVPRTFTIGKATSTTAVTCPTSVAYDGFGADAVLGCCDWCGRVEPDAGPDLQQQHRRGYGDGEFHVTLVTLTIWGVAIRRTFAIGKASSTTVVTCPVSVRV